MTFYSCVLTGIFIIIEELWKTCQGGQCISENKCLGQYRATLFPSSLTEKYE